MDITWLERWRMCQDTPAMQTGDSKQGEGRQGDNNRHDDGEPERRWWVHGNTALFWYADDDFGHGSREERKRMGEAVLGCWFQWL